MRIVGILQARTTSTRLPGKVLAPIMGQPMIVQQARRLARSERLDALVIATSTDPSDDALAALTRAYRGPLDDVLARYSECARAHSADVVVRLTGDCPLADPAVVDHLIEEFLSRDVDYASNTLTPTYPDGLDVEVIRADVLHELRGDPTEREHVTLGIYRHPERYRLHNATADRDLSGWRWTVDTAEDLAWVRRVYRMLSGRFTMHDVAGLIDSGRLPAHTGVRNAAFLGQDTGVASWA